MRQNLTIFLVILAIFCLGLWGQYERSPEEFTNNFSHSFYQILMLFGVEGDWTNIDDLPWQIEVTRVLAPTATLAGVLLAIVRGSWFGVWNSFVRFKRDHVVIAGLGEKSWQFIQSAHPEYKLVVVELDEENKLIERVRSLGIPVIIGNIFDDRMFERANLASARHLVTFTGNDGLNVELTLKARAYVKEKGKKQLRIHLHLNDSRIAHRLADYPKFFSDHQVAEINFFSVYDLNARILFSNYNPDAFAQVFGQDQVHLALYKFGKLAEHILLEAVRTCHYANNRKIRFTVFDEDAPEKEKDLMSGFPQLRDFCEIEFISLPLTQAREYEKLHLELLQSVTQHVVCGASDEENLEISLSLRSMLLQRVSCNAPIMVRMQQSSGLAQLLESNYGGPEIPDGLFPFGMLDEVLNSENILSDRLDALARVLHQDYLKRRGVLEVDTRLYSTLNAWESLPEPDRKSNRLQADHLAIKLRAADCSITDEPNEFSFTDDEAELLARMEHDRWRFNKMFDGWKAGQSRIEGAKVNPYAVSWDEIPAEEREEQKESIKSYPTMLAEHIGRGIRRDLLIGVTGHRLNKLDITDPALTQKIRSALREIVDSHPGNRYVLVSPLAEGADRLIATIAMDEFDMALQVPLPLPYEAYVTDFVSNESIEEFKDLVGRAEAYYELPMKFGSLEELAVGLDNPVNEKRNRQYALVGAYLVERCDELIAVYDGEPVSGEGGTGQIVQWRCAGQVPDEYHNRANFFRRPEIRQPHLITP